jgi:DNA-binding NtrC family response regulator
VTSASPPPTTVDATESGPRGDPGGQRYFLVFEPERSWVYRLPEAGELLVGRGPEAQLQPGDPTISRLHAQLTVDAAGVTLADRGSRGGTRVNGEKLAAPRRLVGGDTIALSPRTTLVFHDRVERASPASSASVARTLQLGEQTVVIADPAMDRLYHLVERLAASDLPVLVLGETGTGKELVATAVHHGSPRRAGPLVSLNCAALSESVVESELFGHARGAFTGAHGERAGVFEAAEGGTLFLDEIGELSPPVQAKLLRVLESRRYYRLGEARERTADVRLVTATHRDLSADIAAGRFRQDLYFRLDGGSVWVPPLRDRPGELAPLARAFLDHAGRKLRRAPMELSPATLVRLGRHTWPGNVRELRHLMEYLAATVTGAVVEPVHVHERLAASAPAPSAPTAPTVADEKRRLEVQRMTDALRATGGNKTRAAALIGMPVKTFFTKLRKYGVGED